ncbi:Hypothetical protein CAP_0892 [Chondromyces apiculatus DSM 436]|uniref:Uncharacterized protein n=1 Tax=Chondromyces apiculatus DSM 436 TaxID=1192034 RepID=A0A017STR7_9BACT|nr:Hypothetical protein CAP_0892 [Chondromyces apiculatus DSM 436]
MVSSATASATASPTAAVIAAGAAAAGAARAGALRTSTPPGSGDALAGPEVPAGEGCAARGDVALFVSPATPRAGVPLRIVAVSSRPLPATPGALVVRTPQGGSVPLALTQGGGPPWWSSAEIASPAAGSYRAALGQGAEVLACKDISVAEAADAPSWRAPPGSAAWRSAGTWTAADEDLYAAWIERLFDAPLAEQPSWRALHEVLRDQRRNFLHNHLGQGEDDPPPRGLSLDPDCADLPYFLRAYFAFKLGLPFGFSACTRGGPSVSPGCGRFRSSDERPTSKARSAVQAFNHFLRVTVADTVHSGSGRVPSTSDEGDYYPVALTAESLRPGTIFADPYGHVLMVAKRLPQTADAGGVLLAVDGQPDGTVARRRYWRGNFLFALDPSLGGPGFKRFRPLVRERGRLRRLTNDEIAQHPAYGDYSRDQHLRGVEGFYDKVDAVLSPDPLDPQRALLETVQALEEQVRGRVLSVRNGQEYLAKGNASVDMPKGAEIFETVGPWEDFSTPSRDLRLLIAIDVVRGLPARVERLPARYAMPPGRSPSQVRAELEGALGRELQARQITYPRTDGSEHTLTLADVVARAEALEMAYNPNDCAEVRWGAPEGSDEARTCTRRAPWSQRIKMQRYRGWFRDRLRPPRG